MLHHIGLLFLLLILDRIVNFVDCLAFFQKKTVDIPRPIQNVAIIGSGIAGLSLAHALTNDIHYPESSIKVTIFDSRKDLDTTLGAGVQLNGGLAVLGKINPIVQNAVIQAGMTQTNVQSNSIPWFVAKDKMTSTNNMDTLINIELFKVVEAADKEATDWLMMDTPNGRKLSWISIMRGSIQQALLDTLPKNDVQLQYNKDLRNIKENKSFVDGGILCQFTDDSEVGPFDMVIGCDGINSSVRRYVESGNEDSGNNKDTSAIYSGIRIRYAVSISNEINQSSLTAKLSQYFGNGAYALHGTYGAGFEKNVKESAFVVYLDDNYIGPFKKSTDNKETTTVTVTEEVNENADWNQDNQQNNEIARIKMNRQLYDSDIPVNINDPLGRTIANADQFFELGVYFHNPFIRWNRLIGSSNNNFVVLCGDAAHAFPPFLGQGSNQAIQDSYCLASKLHQFNNDVNNGKINNSNEMQGYLDEYQKIRFPSTFGIFWKSAFLGYLETGGKNGFYSKFRDAFFKSMSTIGVAKSILIGAATPKIK